MKTSPTKDRFTPGSLRGSRGARTVLLRMAEDEARAGRIRDLKQSRPDLTWRRIADYVGVSERAAVEWQKTGGIEYDNARKLAELFDVDQDYVWSGPREHAPELMDITARAEQIEDVDQKFTGLVEQIFERDDSHRARMYERMDQIEQMIDETTRRRDESIAKINALLARQSEILERIEVLVATLPSDETTARLLEAIRGAA